MYSECFITYTRVFRNWFTGVILFEIYISNKAQEKHKCRWKVNQFLFLWVNFKLKIGGGNYYIIYKVRDGTVFFLSLTIYESMINFHQLKTYIL